MLGVATANKQQLVARRFRVAVNALQRIDLLRLINKFNAFQNNVSFNGSGNVFQRFQMSNKIVAGLRHLEAIYASRAGRHRKLAVALGFRVNHGQRLHGRIKAVDNNPGQGLPPVIPDRACYRQLTTPDRGCPRSSLTTPLQRCSWSWPGSSKRRVMPSLATNGLVVTAGRPGSRMRSWYSRPAGTYILPVRLCPPREATTWGRARNRETATTSPSLSSSYSAVSSRSGVPGKLAVNSSRRILAMSSLLIRSVLLVEPSTFSPVSDTPSNSRYPSRRLGVVKPRPSGASKT